MKVLHFITASVLLLFLFSACGDDEPSTNVSLAGTWEMVAFDYDLTIDSVVAKETYDNNGFLYDSTIATFTQTVTGTGKNMTSMIVLETGPNSSSSSGSFDLDLTEIADGQTTNFTLLNQEIPTNGTWLRALGTLTIMDNGSLVSAFEIDELTETTLKLRNPTVILYSDYIVNDKKYIITQTANHIATYTRQ